MNKIVNQQFQETYYTKTLPSGLKVIAMPKIPSYTTHVSLMLPFGAKHLTYRLDDKNMSFPEGTAHFFEHKIFASKDGDMFKKFVSLGLDANAMTGYDTTQYTFSATSNVYEGLDLLFETVDHTYFTDENILKEKDIINEEIQMVNDRLYTKIFKHLKKNMYLKHPVKSDILGSKDSISKINKDTLNQVHQHFYQDHQRLLLISGNIDIDALTTYLKKFDNRKKTYKNPTLVIPQEPPQVNRSHEIVVENISYQMCLYGVKLHGLEDGIVYEKQITSLMMLVYGIFSSSSTFAKDMMDQGLVEKEISFHLERIKGAEAVTIFSETKHPENFIEAIKHVLTKPLDELIDEEMFLRYKKVTLADHIELLDKQEQKIDVFAHYFIEGLDLFEVLNAKNDLTYEDLKDAYHILTKSAVTTLIVKPQK